MGLDLSALAIMLLGGWVMIHPFLTARKVKQSETWLERNQEGATFVFLGGAFFCLLGLAILTGLIPSQ